MEKIIFLVTLLTKVCSQETNKTNFITINASPIEDEIFNFYRSDSRKREPQFLGFDIQDDNIEIDMEIAVPFLSVPTKKGLSKKRNFANVNVAAVVLFIYNAPVYSI